MKDFAFALIALFFIANTRAEDEDETQVVRGNGTIGLKANNTVCLLMGFTRLDVEVRGPQNKINLSEQYNLDNVQIFNDMSSCLNDQKLSFNLSNNILEFKYKLNSPRKTYNMSLVTFKPLNKDQFSNFSELIGNQATYVPDLKIKSLSINLNHSFECKFNYVIKFNFAKPYQDVEVVLRLKNLKFSAFRKSNSTEINNKNRVFCPRPQTKQGNDVVPIAVGSVLTGCLVVSLVGYLVIRSRRT